MNLCVNLILESEQRSASPVSLRNLRRALPFLVPVAVLLLGAKVAAEMMALRNQLRVAELLWRDAEERQKKAILVRQKADESERILRDLEGWRRGCPPWHRQLAAVPVVVRPQMQLQTLRLSQTLQQLPPDRKPARAYTLEIAGRATGPTAERDVQGLTRDLRESPPFAECMREVEVTKYDVDPLNRAHRIFEIRCAYQPFPFHENARR